VTKAVVIGSGHNALISACYLAKAGLEVEVFERDQVIGGAVSTVERWPGFAVDRGSSLHVMLRFTGIVEELQLSKFGLQYLEVDPWAFAPFWQGSTQEAITFHSDLDKTCASIEKVAGAKDAIAIAPSCLTGEKEMSESSRFFKSSQPLPPWHGCCSSRRTKAYSGD